MSKPRSSNEDPRREVARAILAGRLTRAEAARELGVSKEAVSRWTRKERAGDPAGKARSRFVAVSLRDEGSSSGDVVEVRFPSGVVVRLPASLSETYVARLLAAIASSC